jgi:toxin ParE1/3/4
MQRVIEHPESTPIALDQVRKYKVARFPYSVVYSLRNERIFVSAVAHTSRRPFYWHDRL